VYVGARVGETVGALEGEAEGFGVGDPLTLVVPEWIFVVLTLVTPLTSSVVAW